MTTDYGTTLLDPPWPEYGGSRGADKKYKLIRVKDMPRIIMQCSLFRPADDAHMWMWVTNNFLKEGIALMEILGFRYVTNTVWVKVVKQLSMAELLLDWERTKQGQGQYQRNAHELLLFGTRGKAMVPPPKYRFNSVEFAPIGEHSAKPDLFAERIELVSPGPRLEMFARSRRKNWTTWGAECPSD